MGLCVSYFGARAKRCGIFKRGYVEYLIEILEWIKELYPKLALAVA
jgi:hypothetical protein